ncbi:MAG: SH3 domain-containing protein [Planctomycetes bacterium]|nr:SH3 domain-containing protein [Planctomycetota bacterium]
MRVINDGIRLRAAPGRRGEIIRELGQYTPLHVLGGSGEYFRVRSPDGVDGYVAARLTEPVDSPLGSRVAAAGGAVLLEPNADALVILRLEPGQQVPVLGRYEGFLYVRAPSGHTGWIDADQEE